MMPPTWSLGHDRAGVVGVRDADHQQLRELVARRHARQQRVALATAGAGGTAAGAGAAVPVVVAVAEEDGAAGRSAGEQPPRPDRQLHSRDKAMGADTSGD